MFLIDRELKPLLRRPNPLVSEFPEPWNTLPIDDPQWNLSSSPVQPCSIDIHVGEIYMPGTPDGKIGCVGRGAPAHVLPSGHSVVVRSHERIQIPNNIGGIAPPPSRISSKGILIANFGHVDPGANGHMRFTIINMGKDDFPLAKGDDIMTLLFFRTETVEANWAARNPNPRDISQDEVDVLAKDFADIDQRVRRIANDVIGASGHKYLFHTYVLPFIYGVLVAAVGYLISVEVFFNSKVEMHTASLNKLEARDTVLDSQVKQLEKIYETAEQLRNRERDSMNTRLMDLETRMRTMATPPPIPRSP